MKNIIFKVVAVAAMMLVSAFSWVNSPAYAGLNDYVYKVSEQFTAVENRLDKLEGKGIENRLDKLEGKVKALEDKIGITADLKANTLRPTTNDNGAPSNDVSGAKLSTTNPRY